MELFVLGVGMNVARQTQLGCATRLLHVECILFSLVLLYTFNRSFVFVECVSCTVLFGTNLNMVYIFFSGFEQQLYDVVLVMHCAF